MTPISLYKLLKPFKCQCGEYSTRRWRHLQQH